MEIVRGCSACEKDIELEFKSTKETLTIRDVPIEVDFGVFVCPNCGDAVLVPGIGDDPFNEAYQKYYELTGDKIR